ncbi:MAG: phosphatase PAP2 family protein [Bacteriovorax sp.]|nr:phosphatase PAP2 family protein [Bacteriovorax sp.]
MGKKTLWTTSFALMALLAFFEFTNADLILQERLYFPKEKTWLLKDPEQIWRSIFYTGIKIPIYIIGVAALIASIISWKKNIWKQYRKGLIIVTLTLIILPASIATIGKNMTNVHCPDDLTNFGGKIPYIKLLESYPTNPESPDGKWPRGRCFPAGHASGGFALLSFVCFFKSKRNRALAFFLAMATGWIMGLYQMIRGVHFLSHHLTTMLLAVILISSLNLLIKDFTHERP